MSNVVVVTHWLDGDVIPFVRIGKELKRRGHDVTVVTHCHFADMIKKAGLDFRAWDTPEEYSQMVNLMQQNREDNSFQSNNFSFASNEFRQKTESLEVRLKEYKILDECSQRPDTVFLCKNRSSVAAYLVAEKRKLPLATVIVNPSEVASLILYAELEGDRDLPRINRLRKTVGLDPVDSWIQWECSAKMTLALWPDWYDHIDDQVPMKIEPVGFPMEKGKEAFKRDVPEEFSSWLAKNPRPLLITGGTTKLIEKSFYTNSIKACEMLGQPTVLLCRYKEFVPETLPDNVVWFKYLPLDEIMPEISVLIHHGGLGTVTGALSAGVPQLILPEFVDRPYNATLVKEFGAGDYFLPGFWQPDRIANMVQMLQKKVYAEKCQKFIQKMQGNRGITVAADRVEQMMNNDEYIYSINRNDRSNKRFQEVHVSKEKGTANSRIHELTGEQRARLRFALKRREKTE